MAENLRHASNCDASRPRSAVLGAYVPGTNKPQLWHLNWAASCKTGPATQSNLCEYSDWKNEQQWMIAPAVPLIGI